MTDAPSPRPSGAAPLAAPASVEPAEDAACQVAGPSAVAPRQRGKKKDHRRTPGTGGVRERGAGRWEIKFDVGRNPTTGQRVTRFVTVRASTKREATEALARHKDAAKDGSAVLARGRAAWEIAFNAAPDWSTGGSAVHIWPVAGNRDAAFAELDRLRRAREEGCYRAPSTMTVGEFLERWLTERVPYQALAAKTRERYAEIVRKHLIPALGSRQLTRLAPADLQSYYHQALTKTGERRNRGGAVTARPPLSARTVNHHHRVLSQALKHAERQRLLGEGQHNPALDVDAPRPVERQMNILTDQAQTAALLKAAAGSAIYIPVVLGVTTGMRRGEILGVRWRDIDLDARTLAVMQSLEQTERSRDVAAPEATSMARRGLAFKTPKTNQSRRTIALGALVVDALRRHRVRQKEERLAAGKVYAEHDLICANAIGEPLEPHYVSQAFAKLAKKLGLAVRFHDLRHSHVSHLLAAGEQVNVVSARVGHASAKMTLDRYGHVIPGEARAAADRLDTALRAQLGPEG